MISILGWVVFGLIAGLIAKAIMPGKDPGGVIVTILLGIVGAIVGGFIANALNIGRRAESVGDVGEPGFLVSLLFAVVGAILVLAIYRLIVGRNLRA